MSILINKDTKVITQGITGKTGQFHTEKCIEYANGKNCFVAGVNPKKAGEKILDVPIFGSVKDARDATGVTRTESRCSIRNHGRATPPLPRPAAGSVPFAGHCAAFTLTAAGTGVAVMSAVCSVNRRSQKALDRR